MQGINNKPFIDAAPFLPMDELESMEREICFGIAKSKIEAGIYGPGVKNEEKYKSMLGLMQQYSNTQEGKDIISSLSLDQLSTFFKLYEGMYSASSVVYIRDLKNKSNYAKKALEDATYYTENSQNFPTLLNWIKEKLPFEEIGRIIFFIHEHNCELLLHRDGPGYISHRNEFLWLNPCKKKTFYIHDEKTGERHYVNTGAAFFNDLDEHGGDANTSMTWSLRIDGIFKKEFRQQLGISHLKYY